MARYPDASTTGPRVPLTAGLSMVADQPGQVVEGKDITGTIHVTADDVTVKDCKVSSSNYWTILVDPGVTGARIEHCDVDNQGSGGVGIAGAGTFVGNNVHGCADGIDVRGDNTVIQDNFIHDMQGTSDSHFDGIQADGNFKNLTVKHNTVINEHGQTSAMMLDNYWGPIDQVLIDDNLLCGAGYTIYLNEVAEGQSPGGPVTNVTCSNNHIKPGQYGDINVREELGHQFTITGNVNDGADLLADLVLTGGYVGDPPGEDDPPVDPPPPDDPVDLRDTLTLRQQVLDLAVDAAKNANSTQVLPFANSFKAWVLASDSGSNPNDQVSVRLQILNEATVAAKNAGGAEVLPYANAFLEWVLQ